MVTFGGGVVAFCSCSETLFLALRFVGVVVVVVFFLCGMDRALRCKTDAGKIVVAESYFLFRITITEMIEY